MKYLIGIIILILIGTVFFSSFIFFINLSISYPVVILIFALYTLMHLIIELLLFEKSIKFRNLKKLSAHTILFLFSILYAVLSYRNSNQYSVALELYLTFSFITNAFILQIILFRTVIFGDNFTVFRASTIYVAMLVVSFLSVRSIYILFTLIILNKSNFPLIKFDINYILVYTAPLIFAVLNTYIYRSIVESILSSKETNKIALILDELFVRKHYIFNDVYHIIIDNIIGCNETFVLKIQTNNGNTHMIELNFPDTTTRITKQYLSAFVSELTYKLGPQFKSELRSDEFETNHYVISRKISHYKLDRNKHLNEI